MKSIFVYTHMGLGDHFVCNGLVRELTERENAEKTFLPIREENMDDVVAMYSDDPRIHCIPIANYSHSNHNKIFVLPEAKSSKVFTVGFENCRLDYDVSFYETQGIPFEKRWSSFKCNRNRERETVLEKYLNPKDEPFILVQDTCSLGRWQYPVRSDLKIIYLAKGKWSDGTNIRMIDWMSLIEKATEVHAISSLVHLAASMGRDGVYHDFGRDSYWNGYITLPPNWKTVKEQFR